MSGAENSFGRLLAELDQARADIDRLTQERDDLARRLRGAEATIDRLHDQPTEMLFPSRLMAEAIAAVVDERDRQDAKWGEQNHTPVEWLAILTEEVGEFAEAALWSRFGLQVGVPATPIGRRLVEEATQAAAVAVAILECADRNDWASDR